MYAAKFFKEPFPLLFAEIRVQHVVDMVSQHSSFCLCLTARARAPWNSLVVTRVLVCRTEQHVVQAAVRKS